MADYSIGLVRNDGFKWHKDNGISIKGYIYLNGKYTSAEDAVNHISDASGPDDFIERIHDLNGCFSIVADLDFGVFAVSDTIRSFPLLYAVSDGRLYISDSGEELIKATGLRKINHDGLIDYLHSGCVFYNETLVNGINQVCAMSLLFLNKADGSISYDKYKTVYDTDYSITNKYSLKGYLDDVFRDSAKRLVDSLEGKTAVVALSGGVDSRACLMMLRMMEYENVICFTYGWENCSESSPAAKVAEKLGFRHVFIPHNRKEWRQTYKDEESLRYIRYSGNINAIAHMECHYVLRQLLREKLIPRDSVMITGHIGLIASSKFRAGSVSSRQSITEMFWKYWMKLYNYSGKRKKWYMERLSRYFPREGPFGCRESEMIFENASFDTVRGKHIINFHRLFEMYGMQWRVPLMDYEFMAAFERIMPGIRDKKKTIFTQYVLEKTGMEIKPATVGLSYFSKAYRNLRNPVYGIITPGRFLSSGYRGCLLPPFPVRQYRFLRRFYSYCALQEIKLIKEWYGLID